MSSVFDDLKSIEYFVDVLCYDLLNNSDSWHRKYSEEMAIEKHPITIKYSVDRFNKVELNVEFGWNQLLLTDSLYKKLSKAMKDFVCAKSMNTAELIEWANEHADPRDIVRRRKENESI